MLGIGVGPVRQQHDVLAIGRKPLAVARLDRRSARTARSAPESANGCDTSTCRTGSRVKRYVYVSPGAMPMKLRPGTPSMSAGSTMPCQWIELRTGSVLRTRSVTVSPWRQRSSGAGSWPLTTVARRVAPVKLTGISPIDRSKSRPVSSARFASRRELSVANAGKRAKPNPAATPPSASPCTKRRRDGRNGAWASWKFHRKLSRSRERIAPRTELRKKRTRRASRAASADRTRPDARRIRRSVVSADAPRSPNRRAEATRRRSVSKASPARAPQRCQARRRRARTRRICRCSTRHRLHVRDASCARRMRHRPRNASRACDAPAAGPAAAIDIGGIAAAATFVAVSASAST